MPAVYGSATIASAINDEMDNQAVQSPIGVNKLTAANTEILNGHIGAGIDQSIASDAEAGLIAENLTPAMGPEVGDNLEWIVATGTWDAAAAGPAPANTVAPAITGTEEVGETLTTTNGTWTGTPAPTFTRQWYRDGVAIDGATALTYVLVADDLGAMIDVVVTATNLNGVVTQESNEVGPIAA